VGTILVLARGQFTKRWASLVALGALLAVVGAATLGAAAAARRTSTAAQRLFEVTHANDIAVLSIFPGVTERVVSLPSVERSWLANAYIGLVRDEDLHFEFFIAGPEPRFLKPAIIDGRAPLAADEVSVSEVWSSEEHYGLGDVLKLKLVTPEQLDTFDPGPPKGPALDLKIVGVHRFQGSTTTGVLGTPALASSVAGNSHAAFLRLREGPKSLPAFADELSALGKTLAPAGFEGSPTDLYQLDTPSDTQASVSATARTLVAGLLLFGIVVAVAGMFVIGQALARTHLADATDQRLEAVLGATRGQRVGARIAPTVIVSILAIAVAVVIAVATSSLAPIGSLATYEPTPGIRADLGILLPGAALLILIVVGLDVISATRAVHGASSAPETRRSVIAERLAAIGGKAWAVIGLRHAFERGHGRSAVPVRAALTGAIVGIAGVVAATSIGASIHRSLAEPARYGWQGDFLISTPTTGVADMLAHDAHVDALATLRTAAITLAAGGESVNGRSFEVVRGSIGWTMFEGRMPSSPDEVTVGPIFARRQHVGVDDEILFRGRDGAPLRRRVVGIGLDSWQNELNDALGSDIVFTPAGFAPLVRAEPLPDSYVRLVPSADREAFIESLEADNDLVRRALPPEVDRLGQLGRMPSFLAGFLAILAFAAVANGLVVGVRRRRREYAVLSTLGFERRQVRASVRTASLATLCVGSVVGFPLGLALASGGWAAIANSIGIAGDLARPWSLAVSMLTGIFVVALLAAAVPARRAARLSAASVLREE
jgi:putative ABC transport system permease protein